MFQLNKQEHQRAADKSDEVTVIQMQFSESIRDPR